MNRRTAAAVAHRSTMAFHETDDEMKQRHIGAMGRELGEVYHRLWNDAAWLHLKWNEFVWLFEAAHIQTLNSVAPGFFWQVKDVWWQDILLHLCRMTESRSDVLSVYTLHRTTRVAIREELKRRTDRLMAAVAFAEDARNRLIAHRNRDLALNRTTKPIDFGSLTQVKAAIGALDDVIHYVDHLYYGGTPPMYDHLEHLGGVKTLLEMLDRGLRDRDREWGYIRWSPPADEKQDEP
jgi:hypothetical protein